MHFDLFAPLSFLVGGTRSHIFISNFPTRNSANLSVTRSVELFQDRNKFWLEFFNFAGGITSSYKICEYHNHASVSFFLVKSRKIHILKFKILQLLGPYSRLHILAYIKQFTSKLIQKNTSHLWFLPSRKGILHLQKWLESFVHKLQNRDNV